MGNTVNAENLIEKLSEVWRKQGPTSKVAFICVGSDMSTGDSFGPIVGTLLSEAGYKYVTGTLEQPCDSSNLLERLKELPAETSILAIDSCVGVSVGCFQVNGQPLAPGKFMGKPLPHVGLASLLAVVCRNTENPYRALQTASLHRVMTMAKQTAAAIMKVLPLD
ncbi:MAG: spore protease YyaC [Gorillibacterium sp.]|nr:spore protease YyaC [Gorillibacterium sp.]